MGVDACRIMVCCCVVLQVLHDAFFKHQTKPPLTKAGDLYYEGKEFEAKNQEHKPGQISAELREVRGKFRRNAFRSAPESILLVGVVDSSCGLATSSNVTVYPCRCCKDNC